MMSNIYELLPKHFLKETSSEEEAIIAAFIQDNKEEYQALKTIWLNNGKIQLKSFDTEKAWKSVEAKLSKPTKVIPFYKKWSNIAAVGLLLIVSLFALYQYNHTVNSTVEIVNIVSDTKGQEVVLSDGTKVWLNANTSFSYPKTFESNKRKVSLKGEAFFEVAKNPAKPFTIHTDLSDITVLGTSFNVDSDKKQTSVAVKTGKVKVQSTLTQQKVILTPMQQAVVNAEQIIKSDIKTENYLSWKTGQFSFTNANLKDVVHSLNSYYDTKIILKRKKACHFNGKFDKTPITEIVDVLKLSCGLNVKIVDNNYVFE